MGRFLSKAEILGVGVFSPLSKEGFSQSAVKPVLPSNKTYESKTGCNRTLATVLWVSLIGHSHYFRLPFAGKIPKGTGGRGRDRMCHKLS